MIYIRPRVEAASVAAQKEALQHDLSLDLPDLDPEVFLSYVKAGAIGIDDRVADGTALETYLEVGNTAAANKLLVAGASVDLLSEGKTQLLSSISNDAPEAVRFLLVAAHANPNLPADDLPIFNTVEPDPDPVPATPGHPYTADDGDNPKPPSFATHHRLEITQALVAAGSDLNVRDERTYTPIMIAAATGQCDLVAALLPGHPDLSLRANTGETALDWANQEHPACAPLLHGTRASDVAAATLLAGTKPVPQEMSEYSRLRREARQNRKQADEKQIADQKAEDHREHPLGVFTGIAGQLVLSLILSTLLYCFHRIRSFIRGDKQPVHWSWVPVSSSSSSSYSGGSANSPDDDHPSTGGSSGGAGASRDF